MKRARRRIAWSDSGRCGATFNVINPRQLPEKAEDGRRIWSDVMAWRVLRSGRVRGLGAHIEDSRAAPASWRPLS